MVAASLLWSLATYLPSLLSRYSTQVLVISIPWLLQAQGIGLAEISAALLPFYAGSLVFSALASLRAGRWNLPRALALVLFLQGLFSSLCLLSDSVTWLAMFRFLQGAATGLSRPLAQLWALECEASEQASPERKMQVQVLVQVAIALGMALGSQVGVLLGRAQGGLGVVLAAVLLPAGLACASVGLLARRLRRIPSSRVPGADRDDRAPEAQAGGAQRADARASRAGAWRGSWAALAGAFLVFFASMAAYNVWPILVPFAIRSRALPELVGALAAALALQPLLFGVGQLAVAADLKRRAASDRSLLLLLLAAHGLSSLALWAAALQDSAWLFTFLFLAGSGLAVAAIYPVASLLLMRHVERLPVERRSDSQRQLVFLFGLAGDLGQLAGGGLLAVGLFSSQPLQLLGLLAALALPVLACARLSEPAWRGRRLPLP